MLCTSLHSLRQTLFLLPDVLPILSQCYTSSFPVLPAENVDFGMAGFCIKNQMLLVYECIEGPQTKKNFVLPLFNAIKLIV